MAKVIQSHRGTTAQHAGYTGPAGEVTVDTDKNVAVVHDGSTAGGHPSARDILVAHLAGTETITGKKTFTDAIVIQRVLEVANIVADNLASGDNNIDWKTSSHHYYTTAGDTNAGVNIRGDGSSSLDSLMAVGQETVVVVEIVHTGTAYYINSFKIDGNSVTPKWVDGTAPSSGNVNANDVYTYNILKTASATFTVKAQRTKWA